MGSKIDLHVCSKHTTRSDEWAFRTLGLPASYTEPKLIYKRLKEAGMDYVTITDENSIDGCLEISNQSDAFLSECVVARFPDSKAKIKILTWQITEAQHEAMAELRDNLFELQAYLAQEQIPHAVAHPFYCYNRDVTLRELERLVLMFRHFEGIDGHRDDLFSETARFSLRRLTPQRIERMAKELEIEPAHPDAWRKVMVAGSGDRGGLFLASAYTEALNQGTRREFFESLRAGDVEPRGSGGDPLKLSHGFFNNIFTFAKKRYLKDANLPGLDLLDRAVRRFLDGENPTEFDLFDRVNYVVQAIATGKIFELTKPSNASFMAEILQVLEDENLDQELRRKTEHLGSAQQRAFAISNILFNKLYFRLTDRFFKQLEEGEFLDGLRSVSTLLPLGTLLSPYFYAFQSQAPPREWLKEASRALCDELPPSLARRKRAWFTDTLDDVNGVAMTIRKMTQAAKEADADLTIVVSRGELNEVEDGLPIKNFAPIGEFPLPEYEHQVVTLAPPLEIIEYIHREGFTEVIISTPGPVGLVGLLAAKILGLPTVTVYHTDFPQYLRILTDDHFLESLTWKFMHWFYDSQDLVYVNSEYYRQSWLERGISKRKLKILPRGLDTELFHPRNRDAHFFERYGGRSGAVKLLYVGRISREKDLDVIVEALDVLAEDSSLPDFQMHFVGHGPYVEGLKANLPDAVFTGPLRGQELSAAYASGDVFLFPSTTDTFGNVVIEAHASGLPVVVSDAGGPKDLVQDEENGYVTPALNAHQFAEAMQVLLKDDEKRRAMGQAGRASVEHRNWSNAFAKFWDLDEFSN